jgi:uncharacterized SAM-binding protein YcdF (DUF218 family)
LTDFLFVLSKLLWLVLRPGTFAVLLAFVGLLAVWRGRRWGRWPILAGIGFYLALLVLPLHVWVQKPLEDRFPRPDPPPVRVDGIVVLGGAVEQDLTEARGIPSLNGAAERMTEPVALMRRYPDARLVFTGGQGALLHGGLTEADVARQLWTGMGVPPERVFFETASRNTHENAVLARALAKPRPGETWLLITSASHMPRSVGVFRQAGWTVVPWPVNYRTGSGINVWLNASLPARLGEFEWSTREWIGMVAYWLMGRTDAVFPAPQSATATDGRGFGSVSTGVGAGRP